MKEFSPEDSDQDHTEICRAHRGRIDVRPSYRALTRIEREIGRGSMGAVYEALRAGGEFHHRVAIKLIRSGLETRSVARESTI